MFFDPNYAVVDISLPDLKASQDLGSFFSQLYVFAIAIVGIVIFVRFLWAGWLYIQSAGNSSKVGEAHKIMTNAVIGTIFLFASYLLLNVINPDLVKTSFDLGLPPPANNAGSPAGGNGRGPQLGQLCEEDLRCPAGYVCAPDQESGEFVCSYCQSDSECAIWGNDYTCNPASHICTRP